MIELTGSASPGHPASILGERLPFSAVELVWVLKQDIHHETRPRMFATRTWGCFHGHHQPRFLYPMYLPSSPDSQIDHHSTIPHRRLNATPDVGFVDCIVCRKSETFMWPSCGLTKQLGPFFRVLSFEPVVTWPRMEVLRAEIKQVSKKERTRSFKVIHSPPLRPCPYALGTYTALKSAAVELTDLVSILDIDSQLSV